MEKNQTPVSRVWLLLPACALLGFSFISTRAQAQSSTVQIGELGQTAHVSLHVGDTLRVILKANVSTGYSWQVTANNSALLEAGAVANLPPETKMAGAPGRQRLSFTAKAVGDDHLVLAYKRPWEKKVAPARSLDLVVMVAKANTGGKPEVKPAGLLIGKYTAKLPCADCSGIEETLALYSPGANQFVNAYYVQTMKYLGRSTTYVSAGKWFVERGTPADKNATVYSLSLDSSERKDNYQLKGDSLIPLDDQKNVVHSPYSMPLQRTPTS